MPYDLFVSYARADDATDWITRFVEALQEEQRRFSGGREFRLFFDREEIRSLDDWRHRIYEGLAGSSLLLAFVSPKYFASEWCRREWRTWVDVEISKHVLSNGAAPIYIVEVPWLGAAMSEQQVASELARLSSRGERAADARDALAVAELVAQRQLTEARSFYREGLEVLRREDLRRVLAALAKDLSDRSEHVQAAGRSFSTVPPYNRRFVGRLQELTQLRERLHQGRTGVIAGHRGEPVEGQSVVAGVHGLGGIGKTELAFTYAHAFAGLYPGGRFYVPCEGRSDLRQALLVLDEVFHGEIADEQRKRLDLHFGAIRDCLRRRLREVGPILLLLDNVTDPALLSAEQTDAIRALGPALHLLATTRLGAPEGGGTFDDVHWLSLGELGPEDSLRLLEKHRPFAGPEERAAAEGICRRLGGFALCVEVVGAYLGQHPEQGYAGFLAGMGLDDLASVDLAAERRDVVTRRHNNEKRLHAILEGTLRDLEPVALSALHFAALLPPDHVVLPWLSTLVERALPATADNGGAWPRAVARLTALALLTPGDLGDVQAQEEPGPPRVVRCHRLVQDYLRERSEEEATRRREVAVAVLVRERTAALQEQAHRRDARWEFLALDALAWLWAEKRHRDGTTLMNVVGCYWIALAEWNRGEPLLRRALALDEASLGTNHADVARDLNNLAQVLEVNGRHAEAEPLYRRALAIWKLTLGPAHENIATVLNNLAALQMKAHRWADAEESFQDALAMDEQLFGPDSPEVARDLGNQATLLVERGRFRDAEPLRWRELEIYEHSRGTDHPDHARALGNLGNLLFRLGRGEEAEALLRRALAANERIYGPVHTSVATDLNDLSSVLGARGDRAQADALMQRAVQIREELLGGSSPEVAIAWTNQAVDLMKGGQNTKAEALLRRAVASLERQGASHPDLAHPLFNLFQVVAKAGKTEEAEALAGRALTIFRTSFGESHPMTIAAAREVAGFLLRAGRPAAVPALLAPIVAAFGATLDLKDEKARELMLLLGRSYVDLADFSAAEPVLARLHQACAQDLGSKDPMTMGAGSLLAMALVSKGDGERAEPICQEVLAAQEEALGRDAEGTLQTAAALLGIYSRRSDLEAAQILLARFPGLRRKLLEMMLGR